MGNAQCYRCKRELDDKSVSGLCRSCLIESDRCTACGEPVDPFTKSAYIEPSTICIECRVAGAEIAIEPRERAADDPAGPPCQIPST